MISNSGHYRRAAVAAGALILGAASMAAAQGQRPVPTPRRGRFAVTAPDLETRGA